MIRVLRVGEMPSKKFPGRGLACYVLSKNKKLKTTLFTPYQCFNDSLIPLKFIPGVGKNKTTEIQVDEETVENCILNAIFNAIFNLIRWLFCIDKR